MSRNNHLSRFVHDESGSYTIWSLIWFMLYVGIGGLAVDTTDAYRNETLLQSTADAAALAGVMSLPNDSQAVTEAVGYAASNMAPSVNGTVLKPSDVQIGHWDFGTRTFTVNGTPENAVRAITRRSVSNGNPVLTNFLRIVGLNRWDVDTDAIAATGYAKCDINGFNAGGVLTNQARNDFYGMCLHGEKGFTLHAGPPNSKNNYYGDTSISTGCTDCTKSSTPALQAQDYQDAWARGGGGVPMIPVNAINVGSYIDTLENMAVHTWQYGDFYSFVNDTHAPQNAKYDAWSWLFQNDLPPQYLTNWVYPPPTPSGATSGITVYDLDCSGQSQLSLSTSASTIQNVVIIANCRISPSSGLNISHSIIANTVSNPSGPAAVSIPSSVVLGNTDCSNGVLIYTNGSVHIAAQSSTYGTSIIAGGDVQITALANTEITQYGLNIEAAGDIQLSANNKFAPCNAGTKPGGPHIKRFALVH